LQNAGFGRELLGGAEAYAVARGARWMEMTVVQVRETLIRWYERRGYRLTGERRPFPYGDERFGVPLRDDLEFVVLEKDLG
jgi:ribosomal protein S18 acetylase RimI-like enzyme